MISSFSKTRDHSRIRLANARIFLPGIKISVPQWVFLFNSLSTDVKDRQETAI